MNQLRPRERRASMPQPPLRASWQRCCGRSAAMCPMFRQELIHFRYRELIAKNCLTLSDAVIPSKWPTERFKAAVEIPSHYLQAHAVDYMRRHYSEITVRVIATHLGYGTLEAGKDYSADCKNRGRSACLAR